MYDTYGSLNRFADMLEKAHPFELRTDQRWEGPISYVGGHKDARFDARIVEFSQDQFVDPEGHKFYGHKECQCRAFHFELKYNGAVQGYWTISLFKYADPKADLGREIMTSEVHRRQIPYGVMVEMTQIVEQLFFENYKQKATADGVL